MKVLQKLLEEIGREKVQTGIQSGNFVFQNKNKQRSDLAREISAAIQQQFGFEPKVMLLEQSDLQKAVKENPYKTGEGKTQHFR